MQKRVLKSCILLVLVTTSCGAAVRQSYRVQGIDVYAGESGVDRRTLNAWLRLWVQWYVTQTARSEAEVWGTLQQVSTISISPVLRGDLRIHGLYLVQRRAILLRDRQRADSIRATLYHELVHHHEFAEWGTVDYGHTRPIWDVLCRDWDRRSESWVCGGESL